MRRLNRPREGEFITIKSYKHDGSLHRTWRDTMVLKTSENALIGLNDHTLVTESDGRRWVTREPALVYFHKHYWFNIVTMIRDNGVSYYCNLASPAILDKEALKYIDYDLDVKVFPNGSAATDKILKHNVRTLVDWIEHERGPFSKQYVEIWYNRYLELSRRQ